MRIKKIFGFKFYIHWRWWNWGKIKRLNGSLMWGYNPYTSYYLGPFEFRKYDEV